MYEGNYWFLSSQIWFYLNTSSTANISKMSTVMPLSLTCIYINMKIRMTYIYIHIHIYIYIYEFVRIYMHTLLCHVYVHAYVLMNICTCVYMHKNLCAYTCAIVCETYTRLCCVVFCIPSAQTCYYDVPKCFWCYVSGCFYYIII